MLRARWIVRVHTNSMLVFGAILAGAGMVLIGLTTNVGGSPLAGNIMPSTVLLVCGAAVVGAAHGFINAPVVTHVTNTKLSRQIGEASTSAAYRFLERIGHVAGPLLVGQLFAVYGLSPTIILQIGIVVALLGLLFAIRTNPSKNLASDIERTASND